MRRAEQELPVRLSDAVAGGRCRRGDGRRLSGAGVCAACATGTNSTPSRDEHSNLHSYRIVPQKRGGVIYSPHGCRPRIARDSGLSELQDAGHAREERHRAQMRDLQRVYPIKDDIPVMLIDEATIESPDFHESFSSGCGRSATSSSRRRPFAASADVSRRAPHLPRRAARPRSSTGNPHLDEVIVAPRARAFRPISRSSAACARRDSISPSISTAARARRCSPG